jgi:uncharacterized protein YcfL
MKAVLLASLLVFGLAGCSLQPETNSKIDRQELKIDPEISYSTDVTELFKTRLEQPNGESLLQIQFAVEARSNAELAWKVTWFDADGMVVEGVGDSYRKATLLGGQTRYFKATAPGARVTSYQLHLREPQ